MQTVIYFISTNKPPNPQRQKKYVTVFYLHIQENTVRTYILNYVHVAFFLNTGLICLVKFNVRHSNWNL